MRTLHTSRQATLFVDGKPRQSGLLKFPPTERLSRCFVGTNLVAFAGVSAVPKMMRPQSLRGQVGAFFLFGEALAAEHMQQLWSLGANVDAVVLQDTPEGSNELQWIAPLMSSLLIAVNPRSRDGDQFPNNAQSAADGASSSIATTGTAHTANAAALCVGSHACVTHTVRESAQCLGGVQLLFPLLARLPGASAPPGSGAAVGSSTTPEALLVQLLGLVCQMLAT